MFNYSWFWDADENEYLDLELAPRFILHYQNYQILSNENILLSETNIYPNPVSEKLYIASENENIKTFTIYSITGKLILKEKNFNNAINVSKLSKGIYFIEIDTVEGKVIKKFAKK